MNLNNLRLPATLSLSSATAEIVLVYGCMHYVLQAASISQVRISADSLKLVPVDLRSAPKQKRWKHFT